MWARKTTAKIKKKNQEGCKTQSKIRKNVLKMFWEWDTSMTCWQMLFWRTCNIKEWSTHCCQLSNTKIKHVILTSRCQWERQWYKGIVDNSPINQEVVTDIKEFSFHKCLPSKIPTVWSGFNRSNFRSLQWQEVTAICCAPTMFDFVNLLRLGFQYHTLTVDMP